MKLSTRRELLERWRCIEEEADEADDRIEPSKRHRLHKSKEQWFADTFNFLICMSKENHIWCGSWDLMGPLLETFYNYFNDEHSDSPLRQLWRRISEEMRQCIQCISQHYQAQEMYSTDYELSSIGPLLDVLRRLDEERVTQHLIEMNRTLARKEYDPARDNAEVVSVMYEVEFVIGLYVQDLLHVHLGQSKTILTSSHLGQTSRSILVSPLSCLSVGSPFTQETREGMILAASFSCRDSFHQGAFLAFPISVVAFIAQKVKVRREEADMEETKPQSS